MQHSVEKNYLLKGSTFKQLILKCVKLLNSALVNLVELNFNVAVKVISLTFNRNYACLNSDLYVTMESTMIFKPNSRFVVGVIQILMGHSCIS